MHNIDWLADVLLNKIFETLYEAVPKDCLVQCVRASALRVLEKLLNHPKAKSLRVTGEVLQIAGGSYSGYEMMKMLLQERGSEVKITEEVVQMAKHFWVPGDEKDEVLREMTERVS